MIRKIKVLHVIYSFEVGGIETLILELSNALDTKKYEFHILILTNDKIKMVKSLNEEIIVHIIPVPSNKIKTASGLYRAFIGLYNIFRALKADIVHTHITSFPLLFILIALKCSNANSNHVRTVHTTGLFYERARGLKTLVKFWADKLAMIILPTRIISVSKLVHDQNKSFFSNIAADLTLIRNGINLKKFDKAKHAHVSKQKFGVTDSAIVVSYVARLSTEKNHMHLVDIWPTILSKVPDAHLLFAGSGELLETVRVKVNELGLEEKITFLGAINNVPDLLSISDVGLFVSSYEGFGLVLIENFAMQVPVVASNIDSFKEVILHGQNGFLVSLEDRQEFADVIIKLCTDAKLREKIANNACVDAQHYNLDEMIQKYTDYYDEVFKSSVSDD